MIKTERDGNDLPGYVGTQWKSMGEKAWEGVYIREGVLFWILPESGLTQRFQSK